MAADSARGIPAAGRAGRRHAGAGGLRPAGLRHRRHLDPASQPDQPRRPDVARRVARLGAGAAAAARQPPIEGPNPARPPSNFYVRGIDSGRPRSGWPSTTATPSPRCPPTTTSDPSRSPSASIDGIRRRSGARCRCAGRRGELTTVAIDLSDVTVDGARAGLVAGRHRCRGAAGARRRRLSRSCTAACGRWPRSSRRPPRSPPVSWTAACPQRDPRTEVGRLSLALNGMLAQIQRAVASSESSAEQARDVRGPDAPLHHRRQPRAAHAADDDPRLRRAVPAGRRPRRRDADGAHRERVAPDGSARRGPAAAGPPRRAASARAAPRRPARAGQRRRARRAVDRAASVRSAWRSSTVPAPRRCSATRPGCGRCWATWWPTRCSTPRRPPASPCGSAPTATTRCSRCATRVPA